MNKQLKTTIFCILDTKNKDGKPAKKQQLFESLKQIKHKKTYEQTTKAQQLFECQTLRKPKKTN